MDKIDFVEDCLYEGVVKHQRFKPFSHSFHYKMTYFWFDILQFKDYLMFKKNKITFFSFFEKDHGNYEKKNLFGFFQEHLKKKNIRDIYFIKSLCLPRILGYVFNPISVFICYDNNKNPKAIIFEVSNTFKERHAYICKVTSGENNNFLVPKKFYVSPFFNVKGKYQIRFSLNQRIVNLFIQYDVENKKIFQASFVGQKKDIDESNLFKLFFPKIFQNIKATIGIYAQALKLFIKGAIYIKKPKKKQKFFYNY